MEICEQCNSEPGEQDHTCPYKEEIGDDNESLCNCCEECRYQCCQAI